MASGFSSFLSLLVDHETDTDVSFYTPTNDAERKAKLLYVMDEASKESKLIAEYHIISKSDRRLSSGENSIISTDLTHLPNPSRSAY